MVRMRCRITEDEPAETALAKLGAMLDEHLLDADERRFVEPRLAQLLGLGEQRSRDKQDLFAAWRLFFERLADVHPTVLVFEDVQWADASLLDFIEYLLEWSRAQPAVRAHARPPRAARAPADLGCGSSQLQLALSRAATARGDGGAARAGSPRAARRAARPDPRPRRGDPALRRRDGAHAARPRAARRGRRRLPRRSATIDALEVPETLHALIAARLDGLAPEERRVLQDGAVLGKTFTPEALAAVSGLDEDELEPLLASLVRKEVLALQTDPRSPEQGQYGFLQELVRHIAAETLSRRERRTRHLAAAALPRDGVRIDEGEIAEVLASHYLDAYAAAPDADDADAVKAQARETLDPRRRAGGRARGGRTRPSGTSSRRPALADEPARARRSARARRVARAIRRRLRRGRATAHRGDRGLRVRRRHAGGNPGGEQALQR